ncbi:helix-turn-helix domain-containing protein [Ochrobactrum sp. MYb379]|uniref:helix-turn-helix domain-containing protein n=1 Tax=Ochrobactrum sp. MYb379 TaxID=2745275 RepID=UPI0030DB6A43
MSTFAANAHHYQPKLPLDAFANETSIKVSALLLNAVKLLEKDESIAIDLLNQASSLLGNPSADGKDAEDRIVVGGLAPWQIKRVRRFIDEKIAYTVSLDEMARQVKLSTSYFSAAFKNSFGVSPHNYVIQRRVEFAKDKMLNSKAPLCEIALDCGLSDQAHLSRVFRRITGTTPSAWRRFQTRPEITSNLAVAEIY